MNDNSVKYRKAESVFVTYWPKCVLIWWGC